jgi:hypothetical protein
MSVLDLGFSSFSSSEKDSNFGFFSIFSYGTTDEVGNLDYSYLSCTLDS